MKEIAFALLLAVSEVESGGNSRAINESEQAYGPFQIRRLALIDVNRIWRTDHTLSEFLDHWSLGAQAFIAYGNRYGAETCEEYARIWNGGPRGMSKDATLVYWQKVQRKMEKHE